MKSVEKRLEEKNRIVEICRRLHAKSYIAAADGNVSWRLSDNEILITPSGKNKGFITAQDVACIDIDNNILEGQPSSERLMHLEVYRTCPEAKAIVHAHPPTAIAWSVARPDWHELPGHCLSEVILSVGRIPIAPYARPGTAQMGNVLRPLAPSHRVMILARHGALSWGGDLDEAYNGTERLEAICVILRDANMIGGLSALPPEEIKALKDMRMQMGPRTL